MADNRKAYSVEIGGIAHTMRLSEADAERYGDKAREVKAAEPKNKSRKPANKSADASTK